MESYMLCVPCLFGLEGLVGEELRRLDMNDVQVVDRRVYFRGGRGGGYRPGQHQLPHGRAGHAAPGPV